MMEEIIELFICPDCDNKQLRKSRHNEWCLQCGYVKS